MRIDFRTNMKGEVISTSAENYQVLNEMGVSFETFNVALNYCKRMSGKRCVTTCDVIGNKGFYMVYPYKNECKLTYEYDVKHLIYINDLMVFVDACTGMMVRPHKDDFVFTTYEETYPITGKMNELRKLEEHKSSCSKRIEEMENEVEKLMKKVEKLKKDIEGDKKLLGYMEDATLKEKKELYKIFF